MTIQKFEVADAIIDDLRTLLFELGKKTQNGIQGNEKEIVKMRRGMQKEVRAIILKAHSLRGKI